MLGLLGSSVVLAGCQAMPRGSEGASFKTEKSLGPIPDLSFSPVATTGLSVDPLSFQHTLAGHPENALRATAILDRLKSAQSKGYIPTLGKISTRVATSDELALAHKRSYIELVQKTKTSNSYFTKSRWSPYGGPYAFEAAAAAAGQTIELVTALHEKRIRNGFAITRPPGHHAGFDSARGYCIFNNIAIAARALQKLKPQRIAIVDFDVHHGNGIQDIFYRDSDVLYISSHQADWPHTGAIDQTGEGPGRGTNINIPLPYQTGDLGLKRVYEQIVRPALRRFKPDIIIAAAGFDSHWRDYQGSFSLSLQGIDQITKIIHEAAQELCDGRIAFVLEGGYQLEVLATGVANLISQISGTNNEPVDTFGHNDEAEADVVSIIKKVQKIHRLS